MLLPGPKSIGTPISWHSAAFPKNEALVASTTSVCELSLKIYKVRLDSLRLVERASCG